jgi:signal transduction histidine kinase
MTLPPGTYEITVSRPALGSAVSSLLVVDGQTTDASVCLAPAAVIVPHGVPTLAAENCAPANGGADPGETVSALFALDNLGTGATSDVVATLLTTGGVISTGPAQSYGSIPPGGPAVRKTFSFRVDPALGCGESIVATLDLRDGAEDLGTVSFPISLGEIFREGFDDVVAPALPPGWTSSTMGGSPLPWVTSSTSGFVSPPNGAAVLSSATVSERRLESPVISVPSVPARLSFMNNFSLEAFRDGGVLEISLDGGPFTDILASGGKIELTVTRFAFSMPALSAKKSVGLPVHAAAHGDATAAMALGGIERVLAGSTPVFSCEYLAPHPNGDRWYAMTAVPLRRGERGTVISHTDVTVRREAELAVLQMQHELAHVSRVSTMAELTASLAHQLNQPLTGILSNAQAARRFLEQSTPDLQELRDICRDIIEDSQHAGEAIRHLREMMARTDSPPVVLDVHAVLKEVCDLASSDAVIRNVDVRLDVPPGEARVRGDRIELQQVFLNLLVNAMDAVCQPNAAARLVRIGSSRDDDRDLVVSVTDTGPGFPPGVGSRVFEPFFTTKAPGKGTGLGLSLSKTIAEDHGGNLAYSEDHGRTRFSLVLPLDGKAEAA